MNTIDTSYTTQTYINQNAINDTTLSNSPSENDNGIAASSTIPEDSVEISDKAKALAEASDSGTSGNSTQSKGNIGGVSGANSGTSSSNNSLDAQIEALEKKIASLEKEIETARRSAIGGDLKSSRELQLKEALLSSYQAQLADLEMQQAAETTTA